MATRLNAAFALTVLILLSPGCRGPVAGLYPPEDPSGVHEIYIVNNHWHAGFVLRTAELSPELRRMLPRFSDTQYIEIGWGDDGFYRAPTGTSGLAMKAMFASKASVLHVVALDRPPQEHYTEYIVDLYRVWVSERGYAQLQSHLESTFEHDVSGNPVELQPGLYLKSWFYRARGRYGVFHTCNQWLADGLRATGFPITPFYAIASDNVGWQIRVFGRKYQSDLLVLRDGKPVDSPASQN